MILDKGKSVVVGTPEELRDEIAGQPVLQIKLTKVNSKIVKSVKQMKQVRSIVADNAAVKLAIRLDDVKSGTPEVVRTVVMAGGKVRSVKVLRPSLEEAYLKVLRRKQTEAS
jgi:ABC-type multidrug transport system ATPase subunit